MLRHASRCENAGMHLAFVEIEHFRGIKRLAVALSHVTAIIGENNFGKTSLLNALLICLGIESKGTQLDFDDDDFHSETGEAGARAQSLSIELTFREYQPGAWKAPSLSRLTKVMTPFEGPRHQIRCRIAARRDDRGGKPHAVVSFRNLVGSELRVDDPLTLFAELRRLAPVVALRSTRFMTHRPGVSIGATDEPWDGDPMHERLEDGVREIFRSLALGEVIQREEFERAVSSMGRLVGTLADRLGTLSADDARLAEELLTLPARFDGPTDSSPKPIRSGFGSQSVALLALLSALLESRGALAIAPDAAPIIVVEDPEAHHHPMMLASIWRLIDRLPAQKLITTNSGDLLAHVPIRSIRRLVRRRDRVEVHRVGRNTLSTDDMRRIGYHVRANRASSVFARCWLLVEGESEYHLVPELARQLGYDFGAEGIRCLEFAQCGLMPLLKVAQDLAIEWHVLTDGDSAGASYAAMARNALRENDRASDRVTELEERNIEMFMWHNGFDRIYREASGVENVHPRRRHGEEDDARFFIERAIDNYSKPRLAILAAEAADESGTTTVPKALRHVIETCVRLARQGDSNA